nr:MAG TPA: hypothetical protein [Caudoviricetes sp.]
MLHGWKPRSVFLICYDMHNMRLMESNEQWSTAWAKLN